MVQGLPRETAGGEGRGGHQQGVVGRDCFGDISTGQVNQWQQLWRLQVRQIPVAQSSLLRAAFPNSWI